MPKAISSSIFAAFLNGWTRRVETAQQQTGEKMIPELPKEVWAVVLGKLERVRDYGRLQQVNRTFNAIIAGAWTKLDQLTVAHSGGGGKEFVTYLSRKEELSLQKEKWLLLVAEMAKKAKNITEISLSLLNMPDWDKGEYVQTLGRALEMLAASAALKIQYLRLDGDLVLLSSAFSSLASFLHAKKETIQSLYIHHDSPFDDFGPRNPAVPPELLQALRGCSMLEWAHVVLFEPGPLNNALLENIISGKEKLENLGVFNWKVPGSIILDSGIQLLTFRCDTVVLENYAEEMGRRGLTGTDEHPLRTVKKLNVCGKLLPSFSLMPNLERIDTVLTLLTVEDLKQFSRAYLTEYRDHPGGRKELTCELEGVAGAWSGEDLADAFQNAFPCQTIVKALGDGKTEIACVRGNAAIIWRMEKFLLGSDDDQSSESEDEGMEYSDEDEEQSDGKEMYNGKGMEEDGDEGGMEWR